MPTLQNATHTSFIHGVVVMMQKVLHNNKNGKKPDLNKLQIVTQHIRICIPKQS
jgi:hypothetical protein